MPANSSTDSGTVRAQLAAHEGSGLRTFSEGEPLVWERTSGAHIWDADGKDYLDLHGGFAVSSVGWCHPEVTAAIVRQAEFMTHTPSAVPTATRAKFYESLLSIAPSGLTRVLPAVTGSLANETAVRLAMSVTGRRKVITFSGGYAGRSSGVVGLAGKRSYRAKLGITSEATFIPFPDEYRSEWSGGLKPGEAALALLRTMLDDPASGMDPPACVLIEPIQGNGGVIPAPSNFLAGLRDLCRTSGALLIFDEIQCGFGRSGSMWACENDGVIPDLMTVGKGIGGGMPVAAVLGREDLMTTWEPDTVTSTFLTNSLNLAAASAAIRVMKEENLVERSRNLGTQVQQELLTAWPQMNHVGDIRGRGLFLGLEIVESRTDREPAPALTVQYKRALQSEGILVGQAGRYGNVLKLSPPLVIDEAELKVAVQRIVGLLSTPVTTP